MPKRGLMETLADEIKTCRKCELWRQRKNAVPGEGNLDVAVMLVGEAPGYWEDLKGRPFVGAAGKILDGMNRLGRLFRCRCCHTSLHACRALSSNCKSKEI